MGRKRRNHGSGNRGIRKLAKQAMGVVRIIVGVTGFGHGVISAGQRHLMAGDIAGFPAGVMRDYTGVSPSTGAFEKEQALKSGSIILGTVVILKLLSWGARHI